MTLHQSLDLPKNIYNLWIRTYVYVTQHSLKNFFYKNSWHSDQTVINSFLRNVQIERMGIYGVKETQSSTEERKLPLIPQISEA